MKLNDILSSVDFKEILQIATEARIARYGFSINVFAYLDRIIDIYNHSFIKLATSFINIENINKLELGFNNNLESMNPLNTNQPIGKYANTKNNITYNTQNILNEKLKLIEQFEQLVHSTIYTELHLMCQSIYN